MALKKAEFSDDEIPIFEEALVYKRGENWQMRMWLANRNHMKNLLLILVVFVAGCATTSGNYINVEPVNNTNIVQLEGFYNEGKIGKINIFRKVNTSGIVEIRIFGPATPQGTTGSSTYIGKLTPIQGFQIYLPPGEYMLAVEGDPSIPVKFITFNLTGGATRNYNIIRTGVQPVLSENFPTNINLIKRGSIFSDYNINNLSEQFARNSQPKFDVVKGEEEKNTLPLYITYKKSQRH